VTLRTYGYGIVDSKNKPMIDVVLYSLYHAKPALLHPRFRGGRVVRLVFEDKKMKSK
jgi:hypothetical protein